MAVSLLSRPRAVSTGNDIFPLSVYKEGRLEDG